MEYASGVYIIALPFCKWAKSTCKWIHGLHNVFLVKWKCYIQMIMKYEVLRVQTNSVQAVFTVFI